MATYEDALKYWFNKDYTSFDNSFKELIGKYEKNPLEYLTLFTIRIFSNIKRGNYKEIAADYNTIGSLDDPRWLYETYPNKYKNTSSDSMVSFALRLVRAYSPHLICSTYIAIDRLHSLLRSCINQLESSNDPKIRKMILLTGLLISDCLYQSHNPEDSLNILKYIMKYIPDEWKTRLLTISCVNRGYPEEQAVDKDSEDTLKSEGPSHRYSELIAAALQGKPVDIRDVDNFKYDDPALDTVAKKNQIIFRLAFDPKSIRDTSDFDTSFTSL